MPTRTYPIAAAVTNFLIPNIGTELAIAPGGGFVLEKAEGYIYGATQSYLQIHDAVSLAALSSGSSVPIRSMMVQAANGFLWQYLNDPLLMKNYFSNGILFVLSSTNAVYTAVVGMTMDIIVSLEEWQLNEPRTGTTVAGDYTTGVDALQVWAESSGPHKLLTLEIRNRDAADTIYVMLFAQDSPALGAVPLMSYKLLPLTAQIVNFGTGGRAVMSALGSTQAQAAGRIGCTVAGSSTAESLTAVSGTDLNIRAVYI